VCRLVLLRLAARSRGARAALLSVLDSRPLPALPFLSRGALASRARLRLPHPAHRAQRTPDTRCTPPLVRPAPLGVPPVGGVSPLAPRAPALGQCRPYSPVGGCPCANPVFPPQRRAPRFNSHAALRVASAPSGASDRTPNWASPSVATSAPSVPSSAAGGAPPVTHRRLSRVAVGSATCDSAPVARRPPSRVAAPPNTDTFRQRDCTHVSKDEAFEAPLPRTVSLWSRTRSGSAVHGRRNHDRRLRFFFLYFLFSFMYLTSSESWTDSRTRQSRRRR